MYFLNILYTYYNLSKLCQYNKYNLTANSVKKFDSNCINIKKKVESTICLNHDQTINLATCNTILHFELKYQNYKFLK